jgi:hypothetical protein
MTTRQTTIATMLALLAPLARAAEPAAEPAAAPATPATPPTITWEPGAWLATNGWATLGSVNASDLPRFAPSDKYEKAFGVSVRQSRLRLGLGVPDTGGLLGGAALKGLVEIDFAGGWASSDESQPVPRLRHAYFQASWKDLGNLTFLVGQTTDIFHGSVAAASLSHLATPRFSGAGFLHRRAPQVRFQGGLGGDLALAWQVAALSPADKTTQTASSTSVGYRSFAPDLEARVALLLRGGSPVRAELGVGGRYAYEKWLLAGAPNSPNRWVKSRAVATDLKVEAGWVALVGGAFAGENLDLESSLAPGVTTTTSGNNLTSVKSVPTKGAWGQLQLTPVKGLQLLVGAGVETPNKHLLPAKLTVGTTAFPSIDRNLQLSAGAIVNLTARWRAGLEITRYQPHALNHQTSRSDQIELGTLLAL